jgi:hypothetical protein
MKIEPAARENMLKRTALVKICRDLSAQCTLQKAQNPAKFFA